MSDLKALGWYSLFKYKSPQVSLPEELTQKWWDKKKQLLAKTHATGVGAELKKLLELFTLVEFSTLPSSPNGKEVEANKIKLFIKSAPVVNFAKQLKVVEELADKEAILMNKGVTKKTAGYLETIASTAKLVRQCVQTNSLDQSLFEALKDWDIQIGSKNKALGDDNFETIIALAKGPKLGTREAMAKRLYEVFKTNPQQPVDRSTGKPIPKGENMAANILGYELRQWARDMTTQLGNLRKAVEGGATYKNYDKKRIDELFKALSVIGDAKADIDVLKLESSPDKLITNLSNYGKVYKYLVEKIEK